MAELTNPPYNRLTHFLEIFRRASLANKGSSMDSLLKNFPLFLRVPKLLQISNDEVSARYSKLLPRYPDESLTEIHYERNQNVWSFSEHQRQIFKPEEEPTVKVSKTDFYHSRATLLRFFWSTLSFSASSRTLGKNFRTLLKIFSCGVTFSFIESEIFLMEKSKKLKKLWSFLEKKSLEI